MSWINYIGRANAEAVEVAQKHFETLGLYTEVKSRIEPQLAKLLRARCFF